MTRFKGTAKYMGIAGGVVLRLYGLDNAASVTYDCRGEANRLTIYNLRSVNIGSDWKLARFLH